MQVSVLLNNDASRTDVVCEHGLSLLIEIDGCSLLFDFGQGSQFVRNAIVLGKDISKVDHAVLSHIHYDHSGGMAAFLAANENSKIYLSENAYVDKYYVGPEYREDAGIDRGLLKSSRLQSCTSNETIAGGKGLLFSLRDEDMIHPPNATRFYLENNGVFVQDNFLHEQNLLLREREKVVLFVGCAHCGIDNIVEKARRIEGKYPDAVIGGFHLKIDSDEKYLADVGRILSQAKHTRFYPCHCTDELPALQNQLHIKWIHAGDSVQI